MVRYKLPVEMHEFARQRGKPLKDIESMSIQEIWEHAYLQGFYDCSQVAEKQPGKG